MFDLAQSRKDAERFAPVSPAQTARFADRERYAIVFLFALSTIYGE